MTPGSALCLTAFVAASAGLAACGSAPPPTAPSEPTKSITASVPVAVRTGGRIVTGVVTESAPTQDVGVRGATLTVTDGPYAGATTTAGARGTFSLRDADGVVNLRVSATNFEDASLTVDAASPAAIVVRLVPVERTVHDVVDWTSPPPYDERVSQGQMTFVMHRAGRVDVVAGANLANGESAPNCGELRDTASNAVVWTDRRSWQMTLSATLSLAAGRYTLKVTDCGLAGRPVMYSYGLGASHPY